MSQIIRSAVMGRESVMEEAWEGTGFCEIAISHREVHSFDTSYCYTLQPRVLSA